MSTTPKTFEVNSHAGAEFFCRKIRAYDSTMVRSGAKILVVGCGAGHEAAFLQKTLDAKVTGVDVVNALWPEFRSWPNFSFQISNVCDLPFATGQFDAVFYHHVIQEVGNVGRSLRELSRVLKHDGWLFVGAPNRNRLVSSVGAHREATWKPTLQNKLTDNLNDWTARIQCKFRNEQGARAGFSRRELSKLLSVEFKNQKWMTKAYLQHKYEGHPFGGAVSMLAAEPFCEVTAPSIYAFAQNAEVWPG